MRVVETSNFGSDYPEESFLMSSGLSQKQACDIAEEMNTKHSGPSAPRYWKVVSDDYELHPGFEP